MPTKPVPTNAPPSAPDPVPDRAPIAVPEIPGDRYFLIIGAMKCATTSLFAYLSEHPAICPARVKEPEYFSRRQGHKVDLPAYEDLWRDFDPDRHAYVMEASTGYTKWGEEQVPGAIRDYGIRPRMAYLMRDPFDRIESHYNFMRNQPDWRHPITAPALVQASNYVRHIDAFVETFGRDSLLLLDYDALAADPGAVVAETCRFLGIDPPPALQDAAARNVTVRPKSELERRLRRLGPLAGLAARAPEGLKRPLRQAFAALRPGKTALRPEARAEIAEDLAPGMARLREVYGVDVARWGF